MKLESVVREYLFENGKTEHRFAQALQFGISCLRELHYDVTGVPVIKILDVNSNDTVDLPDDYLNYIRIGFVDSIGILRELGRNPKIALNRTLDACGGRGERTTNEDSSAGVPFYSGSEYTATHIRNSEEIGRFYGLGGGNNSYGTFRIDKDYGQIQLDCYIGGDTITIEYLADLNKTNGEFEVHPFSIETVKAWIDWKFNETNPNVSSGVAERKRQLYGTNKKLLRSRMASMSVQDLLQAFRKGNKASPKF